MAGDPFISCKGVCVAYGRQEVLRGVDLEIPRGAFLPFIGPNGAGKTTLLRAILGLVPLRRGRIDTPFRQHPAGYVAQQKVVDPLYPVSVRQIVEMGLYRQRGWLRPLSAAQRRLVGEALERFGLAEHAAKTFRELSGGMRQKALVARAVVGGAEVVVMDEPTSELDEPSEADVLGHLLALNREGGKTVLLAHHDLARLAAVASTACRIRHGAAQLVPLASPEAADA